MAVSSLMTPLGSQAPDFALPEPLTGQSVTLSDFSDKEALLVMFICNHCPYVQHLRHGLSELGRDYEGSRLGIVAISSNDVTSHPTDGPEQIAVDAKELDYRFPYLYDESQEAAKTYGVVDAVKRWPSRWTFYIGVDGKLLWIDKKVRTATHAADVAAKLEELGVPKKE